MQKIRFSFFATMPYFPFGVNNPRLGDATLDTVVIPARSRER
jgi:hypothetical protein